MTQDELNLELDARGVRNIDLAELLGLGADKVSKSRRTDEKRRRWSSEEFVKIRAFLDSDGNIADAPDQPFSGIEGEYVAVEVLPTFAGAGGGGNGEGDRETALMARALLENVLNGRAGDFVIINIRGDSMEPDFQHGDQLLVDKRDRSPSQPGPFAIWDGEWAEYVVKNIERLPGGRLRMFSSNMKYTPAEVVSEETRIIGRPVFFGRRL
ncbi:S24 family peptidase [Sphingomonas sp. 10B4]|nr:S24 family peptidase [Sphingomonas sp. 10B4]MDY7525516.1 S24 family peptidase [Sphingomonas sp. 10B4]MEB0281462.1 S24 family peptidase [Sphingomonas sp. 10B4]